VAELTEAELDDLVEQAVVDAYGDDEQLTGLYIMIHDNLTLPFTTTVLGIEIAAYQRCAGRQ
jgi:Calcium binding